ncbi:hypothetical protein ACN47E_006738 [Coniothyrium glycines]
MTCELCNAILNLFRGVRTEDVVVSAFQSQATLDSTKHVALLQQFRKHCQRPSYGDSRPKNDFGFKRGQTIGEVRLIESVKNLGITWELLLCSKEATAEDFAKGGILNPDWIDLDMVNSWKNECLNHHGSKCENPLKIWSTTPAWLVDVELECIVPGSTQSKFIALSYTYGNNPGLKVNAEMNVTLQKHHAFRKPEIASQIPSTVRHAIAMTKALGERYIWVDALCIMHGDEEETLEQLNMMGSIYATAILTIIAADGDADHGILGLDNISESRKLQQNVFPLADRRVILRKSGIFTLAHGPTPYFERAWTFQEHKLAKRKVFILGGQAHWECSISQYHEEVTPNTEVQKYIEPRLVESLAGFPELGSITQIISNYNDLNLRHAEDCSSGISGLLAVLSRTFEGGFLYGLPEMFFDRALAWTPYWPHTEAKRRITSDESAGTHSDLGNLPSWSWVGWQGLVNLGKESSRVNDRVNTLQETTPIVNWYTASSPSSLERRRIRPYWFENREAWKRGDVDIPGWTATKLESKIGTFLEQPRLFPSDCEGQVWRYKATPNVGDYGPSNDWYYPFPVREITSSTLPSMPEQTPYLFTRTQRAHVLGRRTSDLDKDNPDETSKLIALCDRQSGRNIGTLHLHSKNDLMLFPLAHNACPIDHAAAQVFSADFGEGTNTAVTEAAQHDGTSLIELVAISRTTQRFNTWYEEKQRFDEPLCVRESYNVLWIEWTDGIAYRRAAGSVDQEYWERLEREDIDLILG